VIDFVPASFVEMAGWFCCVQRFEMAECFQTSHFSEVQECYGFYVRARF
jgi:hypothetical protein